MDLAIWPIGSFLEQHKPTRAYSMGPIYCMWFANDLTRATLVQIWGQYWTIWARFSSHYHVWAHVGFENDICMSIHCGAQMGFAIRHHPGNKRTGQHPLGAGGGKPSFARMASANCLSRGPAREKKKIMNCCRAYFLTVIG